MNASQEALDEAIAGRPAEPPIRPVPAQVKWVRHDMDGVVVVRLDQDDRASLEIRTTGGTDLRPGDDVELHVVRSRAESQ